MIRYSHDSDSVFDALSRHSRLRSTFSPTPFCVICSDEPTKESLERAIRYFPLQDRIEQPLSITAIEQHNPEHTDWFGFQKAQEISLYYPAYRNVTTLVFTLFHEYGHWLQKHVLSESDWESFSPSGAKEPPLKDVGDVAVLLERWADDFGWFCLNPSFLQRERPRSFAYFDELLGTNNC